MVVVFPEDGLRRTWRVMIDKHKVKFLCHWFARDRRGGLQGQRKYGTPSWCNSIKIQIDRCAAFVARINFKFSSVGRFIYPYTYIYVVTQMLGVCRWLWARRLRWSRRVEPSLNAEQHLVFGSATDACCGGRRACNFMTLLT